MTFDIEPTRDQLIDSVIRALEEVRGANNVFILKMVMQDVMCRVKHLHDFVGKELQRPRKEYDS